MCSRSVRGGKTKRTSVTRMRKRTGALCTSRSVVLNFNLVDLVMVILVASGRRYLPCHLTAAISWLLLTEAISFHKRCFDTLDTRKKAPTQLACRRSMPLFTTSPILTTANLTNETLIPLSRREPSKYSFLLPLFPSQISTSTPTSFLHGTCECANKNATSAQTGQ